MFTKEQLDAAVTPEYLESANKHTLREGQARAANGAIICLLCGELNFPPLYVCKCPVEGS